MVFTGPKNKSNFLDSFKIDVAPLYGIRDDIGGKKANVFFYEKRDGFEPLWKQILPTPYIKRFSHDVRLQEGGSLTEGDFILKGFPKTTFSESQLETSSLDGNVDKYWVINGRAYTTVSIKESIISYDVHIRRYDNINVGDLINPEGDDMGLTQDQVDARIMELVSKGALKVSSDTDRSQFVFSKSFNLTFPASDERVSLSLSQDKMTLYADITLLTNPIGVVPNIVSKENGGGPWGIRFDDTEVSFDGLQYRANAQANWDDETRETNLKYIWETWSGPSEQALIKVASVERYHHDFDSNQGFDIDMNTFNFMTSLDGDQQVQENLRRMGSVTRVVLRIQLSRKDGNAWGDGLYSTVIHHQSGEFLPYLHDFQFKRGITL